MLYQSRAAFRCVSSEAPLRHPGYVPLRWAIHGPPRSRRLSCPGRSGSRRRLVPRCRRRPSLRYSCELKRAWAPRPRPRSLRSLHPRARHVLGLSPSSGCARGSSRRWHSASALVSFVPGCRWLVGSSLCSAPRRARGGLLCVFFLCVCLRCASYGGVPPSLAGFVRLALGRPRRRAVRAGPRHPWLGVVVPPPPFPGRAPSASPVPGSLALLGRHARPRLLLNQTRVGLGSTPAGLPPWRALLAPPSSLAPPSGGRGRRRFGGLRCGCLRRPPRLRSAPGGCLSGVPSARFPVSLAAPRLSRLLRFPSPARCLPHLRMCRFCLLVTCG